MPSQSEFLRRTEKGGREQGTEEPASMREIVIPQIDGGVPGDVRQNQGRGHVHADRLQYDDEECYEGPMGARAHSETRPPRLNSDEEHCPGSGQGWKVELHLRSSQDEPPQALQDLRDCQPEDDREQDREIVKGVHGIERRILGSMITLLVTIVGQFVPPF